MAPSGFDSWVSTAMEQALEAWGGGNAGQANLKLSVTGACANQKNTLRVGFSVRGSQSSTAHGYQAHGNNQMNIALAPQLGCWLNETDINTAMMHELGHIMGFIHEHQRPDAGNHTKFDCSKLFDFPVFVETVDSSNPLSSPSKSVPTDKQGAMSKLGGDTSKWDIKRLCTDVQYAGAAGFSGVVWIPHSSGGEYGSAFDSESIMMYSTYQSGYRTDDDGKNRAEALTFTDGSAIAAPQKPSDTDKQRLAEIYSTQPPSSRNITNFGQIGLDPLWWKPNAPNATSFSPIPGGLSTIPHNISHPGASCPHSSRELDEDVEKRYYTINLNEPVWPKNQQGEHIMYWCLFHTDNLGGDADWPAQLATWIEEALSWWGGGDNGPINIKQSNLGWCNDQIFEGYPDCLRISLSESGEASSTMGFEPAQGASRANSMMIGARYKDTQLQLKIYIHEIGHVLGFEHEHQRPECWTGDNPLVIAPQWDGPLAQRFFTQGADNHPVMNKIEDPELRVRLGFAADDEEARYDYVKLTTDWYYAYYCSSPSWGYLPLPPKEELVSNGIPIYPNRPLALSRSRDVDWNSIMCYSTYDTAGELRFRDGTEIPVNMKPSQQDIVRLSKLYGFKPGRALGC
ncbi:hypothetical protein NA57DRAFT_56780 [Rhizodiscina lignyota]|uniref:Peptidase metallopeptidase domain-containing protein n=1 Tax=Rhizodiscina lignyota TaxID=1504668 RepID=A0A9P4MAX8_9PEZI|nr:hypothetical protein NA57DRAFT_56780 [Rhizodiscina lignyota]